MRSLFRDAAPGDWLLLLLLLAGTGASLGIARSAVQGDTVLVEYGGAVRARLPLAQDGRVEVEGLVGPLTVEVRNGRAAIVEAGCPNRICIRTGWRHRRGEVIVCAPNRVVVRIGRAEEGRPVGVTG